MTKRKQRGIKTQEVQRYLMECANRGHLCPTIGEIADAVGLKSKCGTNHHIDKLIAAGMCHRDERGRLHIHRPLEARFQGYAVRDELGGVVLVVPPDAGVEAGGNYVVEVYRAE